MKYILSKLEFINEAMSNKIKQQIIAKFKKENPALTDTQITSYLDRFEQNKQSPKIAKKDIFQYTFAELEKTIDSLPTKVNKDLINSEYDPNDIVFEDDELVILNGDTKEKCIRYGAGYTWCISRKDSGNMFNTYRYRYDEVNFYFVFDKVDKGRNSSSLVVLVDKNHKFYLADASNAGDFAGTTEYSFNKIVKIQPKLEGKEKYFQPKPLTPKEKEIFGKVSEAVTADDLLKFFGSYELVDSYLGFGHELSDNQYASLDDNMKAKYINLGHLLSDDMLSKSSSKLLERYEDVHSINYILNQHYSEAEILDLESINCTSRSLVSLKGIERCKNLRYLECSHNNITSLEPLSNCPELIDINCTYNKLTNLKGLENKQELLIVVCGNNQLTSIKELADCIKLVEVSCSHNKIVSLDGLQNKRNLYRLVCFNNQITSLDGISGCRGLETIHIGNNQIESLKPLGMKNIKLKRLMCLDNQITSLEGLEFADFLEKLVCSNNKISDLTPIAYLTHLWELSIANNLLPDEVHELRNIDKILDYYKK